MKKAALIPPDKERCQCMKPNGCTFMSLGGAPGLVRCSDKPTVIVREVRPGDDGRRGSMSLCDHCLGVMQQQCGTGFATVTPIKKGAA